jgi:hypothetical protein
MLPYTRRPSSAAATTVARSSSASTRSAAWRATSVPRRPIATPISARRRAGPSLTPSPVMATTSPAARRACTMSTFCSGVASANTAANASG